MKLANPALEKIPNLTLFNSGHLNITFRNFSKLFAGFDGQFQQRVNDHYCLIVSSNYRVWELADKPPFVSIILHRINPFVQSVVFLSQP